MISARLPGKARDTGTNRETRSVDFPCFICLSKTEVHLGLKTFFLSTSMREGSGFMFGKFSSVAKAMSGFRP